MAKHDTVNDTLTPNFTVVAYCPQNRQNLSFWYREKGPLKNLNIIAQLQPETFLYATAPAPYKLMFWKLHCLYSVSIFTKTSHFFVYSRHATHDLYQTWHGDRGCPSHFAPSLTFFGSNQQFRCQGLLKISGKMPPPTENAYNLLVCSRKATKLQEAQLVLG